METETPNLRWFEAFPRCGCGKVAQGILRGSQNQSFGYHCQKCAERRLKASDKARKALAAPAPNNTKPEGERG